MKWHNPCKGCIYWKKLSTSGWSRCACHFLLETGKRRRKNQEGCCMESKGSNKG